MTATPGLSVAVVGTTVTSDPERTDPAIRYANLSDGLLTGSIAGIDVDATCDPELLAACLGDGGAVIDSDFASLQPRRIDPDRTIPFRITMPDGCGHFLAAATTHR